MGRIMLATSASTDEEYGGTYGSTVVLSIPANTYNTYALALSAIETAYDGLTDSEKLRCKIRRNNASTLNIENTDYKSFSECSTNGSGFIIQSMELSTHKFYYMSYTTTAGYADYSNQAQSQKLELIIV